jgi:hypothetical protein
MTLHGEALRVAGVMDAVMMIVGAYSVLIDFYV